MPHGEWIERWKALASIDLMTGPAGEERMVERWRELAHRLDAGIETRPDPILDFVLDRLTPEMTVLDIGAGVGRWTVPLAARARQVTAIEPAEGMGRVLRERLAARRLSNVAIVEAPWLDAPIQPHDIAVAAYSMYTSTDLAAFARKMERDARQLCCLAMRLPAHDGIIGELSERIHGDWHDSPNFIVGYNALLEAGFAPNVYVEPSPVRYWMDPTIQDALLRARRHLRLEEGQHDGLILETLRRRLHETPEGYRWPDWMRAAIIWWEPPEFGPGGAGS